MPARRRDDSPATQREVDTIRRALSERAQQWGYGSLAVWDAYQRSRAAELPTPLWVLREFDKIARRVLNQKVSSPWAMPLLKAFGFPGRRRKGGPNNPVKRWQLDQRDLDLARRVRVYVDRDRHNPTNAYYLVARDARVGEKIVERAWVEFDSIARLYPLEEERTRVGPSTTTSAAPGLARKRPSGKAQERRTAGGARR